MKADTREGSTSEERQDCRGHGSSHFGLKGNEREADLMVSADRVDRWERRHRLWNCNGVKLAAAIRVYAKRGNINSRPASRHAGSVVFKLE